MKTPRRDTGSEEEEAREPEDKPVLLAEDDAPASGNEVSNAGAVKSFIVSFLVMLVSIPALVFVGTLRKRKNVTPHIRKWGPFYMILVATVAVMMDLLRHVLLDAVNWSLHDPTSGKQYKFHLDSCVYGVPAVSQGHEGKCPDTGVGPLQVVEENALGVNMPMYNSDGSYSFYGIFFTFFLTYLGYFLLFFSICWYTGLPRKIASQCRSLDWRGCWAGCRSMCTARRVPPGVEKV
ncbi:hypothetical protein FOZ62_007751 [Perkinsus olseni]|uniref:Uncharacterized protein n=1 Tax=Perkinsus olseni TaxID=32597 RepID=A0A7J6TUW4_PEROL|nr:hypothetical protein FOZ62_007751 [Perkinsus olseni]